MLDVLPACVSGDWVTPVALLGLTVLLAYLYGTWTFSTWSQQGIPGPKPSPFIGNVVEFERESMHKAMLEWTAKYGKTFGIYAMRMPMLLTTDTDIVKEVFIKDFSNFTNRSFDNPLTPEVLLQSLAFSKGHQWRRQRQTMTPTFSASKLKLMDTFISRCCKNLVKSLEKSTDEGKILDVKRVFGSFTLDVIAGTGFGFETNSLADEGNQFLASAQEVFGNDSTFGIPAVIAEVCPPLGHVMKKLGFSTNPMKEVNLISDTIKAVIEARKGGDQKSPDFTQLMLDAEASEASVASRPDQKHMTMEEIVAQGFVFFLAGYETTATTLQYLSYLLALNPDKQETLYREIVAAVGDADPKYEKVLSITYLDNCIHETLRLFPPIPFIERVAMEERKIKDVTIPAGAAIAVNVMSLMREEEFFPQPELFRPERFEDKERPVPPLVREMMFGAGPRQCIGMRLALYEAKMAVVSLVRQFRFVKVKETPEEIVFAARGIAVPTKPIYVGTERR